MSEPRTLLVIAGEFPPLKTIGRIRTVKFVEQLRQYGWRSIVITLQPNGTEPNYDPSLSAEITDGVEVIRLPLRDIEAEIANAVKRLMGRSPMPVSAPAGAGVPGGGRAPAPVSTQAQGGLMDRAHALTRWLLRNFVHVPDDYRPWATAVVEAARPLCKAGRIDAIYTTLPPFASMFAGHALRKETGIPWLVDYRDLWFGDVLREWVPGWRKKLEFRMEKRLLSEADVVITVSEPKTTYMQRLHPDLKARWETLTNGYDTELYGDRQRTRPFTGETVEFVYTGRLFKNRRGHAFAEALGCIHRSDPALAARARVRILGGVEPSIRERYDRILADYGIAHLYDFAGDVSYAEAMNAQVNCDYLLLIVDTGETSDGVIPGKLFEYVSVRRPIFALCDPGATQQIIERARLGKAVPAESVEACEAMLREWLARPVPETVDSDDAYLAQFDRKAITARFARLLDEVVEAARKERP
ncbi:glycosyltransferase [Zoogloea dura]|uniref:Glycosyltransferase family 4 protein n=1 Tax=Zoogloea dura TaxID=2728840 RepID=A0A848FYP3_9RHOO|nr:glycosyltransferase [Zoogloea dura]NML24194.1 glycosyltransferase family 4 protein [Zoogloea dura]